MKYEDLSFNAINDEGIEVICDILSVVPNYKEPDNPYIVYTDYTLDDSDEFVMQYGKVVEVEGEFVLKKITDNSIINEILEIQKDEIVAYVNEQIQESLYD